MKAAVYAKDKSGKHLQILDVSTPIAKNDEVLIKVCAASVNPLDWRMKNRRPGVDVAGRVEAVGPKVNGFKVGDEVFGAASGGAFAELARTSESKLALKARGVTFSQAASIPIAGLTALQALRDIGQLKSGQRILINGASGGVGTFAVQIAKWMGAHVSAVCSARNVDQTRTLGADRVIDYTREDFITSEESFDLILDNVGNRPLPALKRVLTPNGRCVLVGAPKSLAGALTRILKAAMRPRFTFFIAKMKKQDLQFLCDLIGSGRVIPVIDKCYPFLDTGAALAYIESGHAHGKVIIDVALSSHVNS